MQACRSCVCARVCVRGHVCVRVCVRWYVGTLVRWQKANHVLAETFKAKHELENLYAKAMRRKVRLQRKKIKDHDAAVKRRAELRHAQEIKAMAELEARRAASTNDVVSSDPNLPKYARLTGQEYLDEVPKSKYYKQIASRDSDDGEEWVAEQEAGSRTSPSSLKNVVHFLSKSNAQSLRKQLLLDKKIQRDGLDQRDIGSTAVKFQPKYAERPAMPSLQLDVGWAGLGHADQQVLHSVKNISSITNYRSRMVFAMRSGGVAQKQKERESQRDRLQQMLDRMDENMQKAQALMNDWHIPSIVAGGSTTGQPGMGETLPAPAPAHSRTVPYNAALGSPGGSAPNAGSGRGGPAPASENGGGDWDRDSSTRRGTTDSVGSFAPRSRRYSPRSAHHIPRKALPSDANHARVQDQSRHRVRHVAPRREPAQPLNAPLAPLTMKALESESTIITPRVRPTAKPFTQMHYRTTTKT